MISWLLSSPGLLQAEEQQEMKGGDVNLMDLADTNPSTDPSLSSPGQSTGAQGGADTIKINSQACSSFVYSFPDNADN